MTMNQQMGCGSGTLSPGGEALGDGVDHASDCPRGGAGLSSSCSPPPRRQLLISLAGGEDPGSRGMLRWRVAGTAEGSVCGTSVCHTGSPQRSELACCGAEELPAFQPPQGIK